MKIGGKRKENKVENKENKVEKKENEMEYKVKKNIKSNRKKTNRK